MVDSFASNKILRVLLNKGEFGERERKDGEEENGQKVYVDGLLSVMLCNSDDD